MADDVAGARAVAERYLADGAAMMVEERVAMRRELAALVARSPFGQGAAWPVVQTVQRDGICVEVIAPAPGLMRRNRQRRRAIGACEWPQSSVWSGCWPWSCSRPPTAACWSTSWRCARTTPGTGPWTAPHQSVRTAPARGAGLSAGRHPPIAPVTVMANVLGAPEQVRRWPWTSDCTTCSAGCRRRRCTCTARPSGPAARSGTSTCSATPADRLDDDAYVADVRERAAPCGALVVTRRVDRRMGRALTVRRSPGSA